jgi:hypothetical protein
MALVLKDRVKETTTTTGTGTLTLAGASTGYQSFSAIGDGNTCYYAISSSGSSEWEVGLGTYSSFSGTVLARTTILASSNSGSVVNLSAGTKDVYVVYPAGRSVYQDSLLTAYAPQYAASNGLLMNNMTIATSFTIPTGYSASSTGAITLNSGVSVTVPSGSRWVVL